MPRKTQANRNRSEAMKARWAKARKQIKANQEAAEQDELKQKVVLVLRKEIERLQADNKELEIKNKVLTDLVTGLLEKR